MNTLLQIATDANSFQGWASIIQVVISAVTAFFLIQTFVLQAKTLKEQQEITKIEQTRFILKFLPKLSVENVNSSFTSPSGFTSDWGVSFDVIVCDNYLQELSISFTGDENIHCVHSKIDPHLIVPVGGAVTFQLLYSSTDMIKTKFVNTFRKYIHIRFKDAIGTSYEQTIIFNAKRQEDVAIQPAKRL